METKTYGCTWYIVEKYRRTENDELVKITDKWLYKEIAFRDYERWKEMYGDGYAFIFEAKQCMKVGN